MHRQMHRQRVADRRCMLRLCVEHLAAMVSGCRALRALRAINAALHACVPGQDGDLLGRPDQGSDPRMCMRMAMQARISQPRDSDMPCACKTHAPACCSSTAWSRLSLLHHLKTRLPAATDAAMITMAARETSSRPPRQAAVWVRGSAPCLASRIHPLHRALRASVKRAGRCTHTGLTARSPA